MAHTTSYQSSLTDESLKRRQSLAEQRKERLLNPKVRTIGIDVSALDEQVREKERLRQLDVQNDELYHAQMVQLDQQCVLKEKEIEDRRRQIHKELVDFRNQNQRKELSREWDLNDPKRVAKDAPARIGDEDPRCGLSSVQQFDGEDLVSKERRKLQVEQMKLWTRQQVDEKDVRKMNEKQEQQTYDERAEAAMIHALELERGLAESRRKLATDTAYFNRSLSELRKQQTVRDGYREQVMNLHEIQNALDSDFLTETQQASLNSTNPDRFKPDCMKRFLPQQTQAILDEQARQREENQRRKEAEKAEDKAWAVYLNQIHRAATLLDRQRNREGKLRMKSLSNERMAQHQDQLHSSKALDKLYRNEITEDFHKAFGSSLR